MSIEKQYYTPTLSEFHVNFRYEYLLGSHLDKNIPNNEKEWGQYNFAKDSPPIFDIEGWRMNLEDCIKDGFIRVKSLDHDDIKEAGWEFNYEDKFETYKSYTLEDYVLTKYNDRDDVIITDSQPLDECTTFFDGTVKNFNKLLDVMEMLGITANS